MRVPIGANEVLIPTCDFRWFIDQDRERILQQRFVRTSGGYCWRDVPEITYDEDLEGRGSR